MSYRGGFGSLSIAARGSCGRRAFLRCAHRPAGRSNQRRLHLALQATRSRPENLFGWQVDEGDGWVNWSELATLLAEVGAALPKLLGRLLVRQDLG